MSGTDVVGELGILRQCHSHLIAARVLCALIVCPLGSSVANDTPMPGGATGGIFGLRFWDARHGMGVGGDFKREREASKDQCWAVGNGLIAKWNR